MVELVVKLGLKREPGYLYFVGHGKLYRTKLRFGRRPPDEPEREIGPEDVVVDLGITQDPDYDYFLDNHGDIRRTRREGPALMHPPGDYAESEEDRQRKFERFREKTKDLVGPCELCGKPVPGRVPPGQPRRHHPRCPPSG